MTDLPQTARRRRIATTSRIMAWSCLLVALLLPLAVLGYWLVTPAPLLALNARVPVEWLGEFGLPHRLAAAVASHLPLLVLAWGLWRLRRCFMGFAQGELFQPTSLRGFRDFSVALAAAALVGIPAQTLLGIVMSWGAPAGQKQLVVSVSSDMLLMLFLAAALAVIGWVLAEAAAIAEENASFV